MDHKTLMDQCIRRAQLTAEQGKGGPFGAAVTTSDGEILSVASNSVLSTYDPTAHAEINAIREACTLLGTHDLTGCVLFATGYPCPMCLAAAIWANISEIVVGSTPQDAEMIGFRDQYMYEYFALGKHKEQMPTITMLNESRNDVRNMYNQYKDSGKQMY